MKKKFVYNRFIINLSNESESKPAGFKKVTLCQEFFSQRLNLIFVYRAQRTQRGPQCK